MRMNERDRWLSLAFAAGVFVVPILPLARGVPIGPAPAASLAAPEAIYVPASAHAGGANGADWRTDLQIHNADTAATTATIALLARDATNPSPDTRTVAVAAGASVRLSDVLSKTFGFTGAAALRVTSSSPRLVVTSRTYNLVGEGATGLPRGASFGQFVRGVPESAAIAYGQEGRLIQLTQRASSSGLDFRTNVGVVNVTLGTIDLRIDLYRADGSFLGTRSGSETRLRALEFRQITEIMSPYGTIADGYAVARTTTPGGRFLAFATVIDNHVSGDPVFVPAARVTSAVPTPTPTATAPIPTPTPPPAATPTPTPTPSSGWPNLVIYRPPDWPGCVVCNYQNNCCPPSTELLSEHEPTVVMFAVANTGAVRLAGPVNIGFSLDGVLKATAPWSNDGGLDPGYFKTLSATWPSSVPIPVGRHTLTVTADPYFDVAESNETDNSCGFTGDWSSVVLLEKGVPGVDTGHCNAVASVVVREAGSLGRVLSESAGLGLPARSRAGAGETWIPASAHATGVNGTNWRTDLEIHNPGTTAAGFTIHLLPRDADNTAAAAQRAFSLDPQKSVRYVDVLESVFRFTGAAALRIVPTTGTILATSRTYNLVGVNPSGLPVGASFGQFVPGIPESEAISSAEEGRLIQLTQRDAGSGDDFRTNVGIVNTTGSSVDVRLDFFRADGTWLGVKQGSETRLPPYGFRQLTEAFGTWGTTADGYVVARPTTSGGRIFAFATVIDNHATGDPVFIPAERMTASTLPTPTPTPTPTVTPTPPPGGVAISTTTTGSTVTVTQSGTLKDLGFTFPGSPPAGFAVWTIPPAQVPQIPPGVTRLSDFFRTSRVAVGGGLVTLTLPVSGLPAGRSAEELRLYVYSDAAQDASAGSAFSGQSWLRTWYDLNVLANGRTTIRLQGLGDLSFIGIEAPVASVTSEATRSETTMVTTRRGPLAVTSSCEPKRLWVGRVDGNQQVCAVGYAAGKSFTVTVKNFGDLHLTPAATMSELVGWLGAARLALDGYELSSDATFEVEVGRMPVDVAHALGYVTTADLEDRRVLHVTNAPMPKNAVQGTVVHEYFHHAQARTNEAGKTNLINNQHKGDWLIEGLARWFEDDLFDSLDTYALKERQPLARILEVGLGAAPDEENDARTRGYSRFAFWKMVQSRCSGFAIREILNHVWIEDPRGVANLGDRMASSAWQCDFGGGLGEANRAKLANALLEYTFATVKNDDVSRFDSNEPAFKFENAEGALRVSPSPDCTPDAPCAGSIVRGTIPAASAAVFVVDGVLAPPPGQAATLWLSTTPKSGDAILWVGEADRLLSSPAMGKWADVTGGGAIAYGEPGRAPKMLAVIVNPSPILPVTVAVRAGYGRPRLSLGNSTYTFLCTSGICALTCGLNDGNPVWSWPLTWTGNSFVSETSFIRVTGEVSTDRKTLLSFRFEDAGLGDSFETYMHWVNLPLDTARSTSGRLVYSVEGQAAAGHIAVAKPRICSPSDYSGIDYGKPVLLEVILDP
jgi:hypothetical protein